MAPHPISVGRTISERADLPGSLSLAAASVICLLLAACAADGHSPEGGDASIGGAVGGLGGGGLGASAGGGARATGGTSGRGGSSAGGASAGSGGALASGGRAGGGGASPADGAAAGGSDGGRAARAGTIVPLYTYPTDGSWSAIIQASLAHPTVPVLAIFNPSSGAGAAKDQAYGTGVARLKAAGIVVLGYVATTYGRRPESEIHAEMDHYGTWYPETDGIFFDEMDSAGGTEAYYSAATAYARSQHLSITVGNPGTQTKPSYIGTVDTMTIYESAGLPTIASLRWTDAFSPHDFAIIPYRVPSLDVAFVQEAAQHVGYVYLTNDDLSNPWDSLPPYFGDLLAALE